MNNVNITIGPSILLVLSVLLYFHGNNIVQFIRQFRIEVTRLNKLRQKEEEQLPINQCKSIRIIHLEYRTNDVAHHKGITDNGITLTLSNDPYVYGAEVDTNHFKVKIGDIFSLEKDLKKVYYFIYDIPTSVKYALKDRILE